MGDGASIIIYGMGHLLYMRWASIIYEMGIYYI
jgi:hypothetical protein